MLVGFERGNGLAWVLYYVTRSAIVLDLKLSKMKTIWNSSNYGNDLKLTKSDAESVSHSGRCDDDVDYLMTKPYVIRQLKAISPEQLRKELYDYGAWDDDQLADHNENLKRWVWISGGDIIEGR